MANPRSRTRKRRLCLVSGILDHAGSDYDVVRSSTISESSAIVFWILRRISSAISSTLATALRIHANCHFAGKRFQFAADVLIADFAAAILQDQQVAQQFVKRLQMEFELLALAPADGFGDRYPRAEGTMPAATFSKRQHGRAALVVHIQIERQRDAGAAAGQGDAAIGVVHGAGAYELPHFIGESGAK